MRVIEGVGIKVKRFRKRCMAFKTEANTEMGTERGETMVEMGFWIEKEFTNIHTLMKEMAGDRAYEKTAEMVPSIYDLEATVRWSSQWVKVKVGMSPHNAHMPELTDKQPKLRHDLK